MPGDVEHIELLLHLLTAIKDEKDKNISDLLRNGDIWKLFPTSTLKETLHHASTIQSTLQDLTVGIQNSIVALESWAPASMENMDLLCLPLEDAGILSLPNEVLCIIAEDVQEDSDILPFSQTCSKLREAALSHPVLWTRITSDLTIYQQELYLTRSHDVPLDVKVHLPESSDFINYLKSLSQFAMHILQHSHRWRSFSIHISRFDLRSYMGYFLAYFNDRPRELPILQSLSIHLDEPIDDERTLLESSAFHIYTHWTMPALRSFSVKNFIPRCSETSFGSVTSISIAFRNDEEHRHDLLLLFNFLRSVPRIRHLKLAFDNCNFISSDSSLVLHNVETLEFAWLSDASNHLSLRRLMGQVSFPNLVKLKASLEQTAEWSDVNIWLTSLFSGQRQLDKVTSFEMSITRVKVEGCSAGYAFPNLPNLEELSVEALDGSAGVGFWGMPVGARMPPTLRCIRFRLGGQFHDDTILNIVDSTEVERVEFTHCPSFIRSHIESRIGSAKLIWKEEDEVFRLI